MAIELPPLPYADDALAPHISEKTIRFHYGKHHKSYVDKLNRLIEGSNLEGKSLEDLIQTSARNENTVGIFNNAAQVWNHSFYWNSMKPSGGGVPSGEIAKKIDTDLGGNEGFREAFKGAAANRFGSGWAWLVLKDNKLEITNTLNADLPMAHHQKALLTIDVWEHAYYLDYQNLRPNYIDTFLDHLVNWDFANQNLLAAQ